MRFIISIFLLLSTNAAFCCCNSYAINIYPFKKEISENSIFIIGYNTDLYKFNVEKLFFKAKTLNGNLLDLKIKKKYLIGSEAQIILSCSKNFTLNDSISILVEKEKSYNTDTANILKFISQVEYEKWFVKNKKDTEKPKFTNKATTYRPISMSSTSIEGFRVLVNCDVTDNSINTATNLDSTHIYYPIFYEIEINKEKYLSYLKETIFDITSNICSRTFTLNPNKEYKGTIRIMDLSGNFSLNSKTFPFYINK